MLTASSPCVLLAHQKSTVSECNNHTELQWLDSNHGRSSTNKWQWIVVMVSSELPMPSCTTRGCTKWLDVAPVLRLSCEPWLKPGRRPQIQFPCGHLVPPGPSGAPSAVRGSYKWWDSDKYALVEWVHIIQKPGDLEGRWELVVRKPLKEQGAELRPLSSSALKLISIWNDWNL